MMLNRSLEEEMKMFIKEKRAVYLSDIARQFNLRNITVTDILKRLEKRDEIEIRDKGIAKLVLLKSGVENEKK